MERTEVDLPFLKKQRCSVPLVMRWPQGISNRRKEKKKKKSRKEQTSTF